MRFYVYRLYNNIYMYSILKKRGVLFRVCATKAGSMAEGFLGRFIFNAQTETVMFKMMSISSFDNPPPILARKLEVIHTLMKLI